MRAVDTGSIYQSIFNQLSWVLWQWDMGVPQDHIGSEVAGGQRPSQG